MLAGVPDQLHYRFGLGLPSFGVGREHLVADLYLADRFLFAVSECDRSIARRAIQTGLGRITTNSRRSGFCGSCCYRFDESTDAEGNNGVLHEWADVIWPYLSCHVCVSGPAVGPKPAAEQIDWPITSACDADKFAPSPQLF